MVIGCFHLFVNSFCRSKSNRLKGDPFRLVSATPVDLFPQTHHCELVIVLERVPAKEEVKESVMGDVMDDIEEDSVIDNIEKEGKEEKLEKVKNF